MAIIETYDRYTLDSLTNNSVSILKQTFAIINNEEEQIGKNWRKAFINTPEDKEELKLLLGEASNEYLAILQMWRINNNEQE